MLLTPLASWLGWRVIWLQDPSFDYAVINHYKKRYLQSAEQAEEIICFANLS